MRRKRKKKKNNFKKLAGIFTVFFVCTLLAFYRYDMRVEGAAVTGNNNEIRILEIEPGNQFLLGSSKSELTLIGDCSDQTVPPKTVKITHVTMAQFISMVEEINGKYDVVVIGRKNGGLLSSYIKGTSYRDYTNPLSQALDKLPLSTWEPISNWKNNYTTLDGIKFAEYYSENDITQKKADEIKQMINSNQLVYMDDSIFNTTSNGITKTKLYSVFSVITPSTSFVKQSLAGLTVAGIVKKYNDDISNQSKRPQLIQVTKPTDDSALSAANATNRNMKFTITLVGNTSEVLTAKLFLDLNADGLFKEKESVVNLNIQEINGQKDYDINYTLDNRFVGYLDWKVEIARGNGVKTNILGSSNYKTLVGKKSIKVLQIRPVDSSFNLSTDTNTKSLINSSTVSQDYNITIESKTVDQVNNLGKNLELNGKYDMVILGFADSYGQQQLNLDVVNQIKSFIETGQSVMFTHDTMTPSLTNELQSNTGPKLLTRTFRDYVGQARYPDPYRLTNGIVNEVDLYKNYTVDSNGNVVKTDRTIPHGTFNYNPLDDNSGNANKAYSLGTTFQGHVSGYQYNWNSWDYVTKVKKINTAQINKYPFPLNDEISTATTHTQWYQLNLEDPDVVPWYDMSSTNFDSGDARNYYYTYSKGNITYSGAGHSLQNGFTNEELQLFINTMIKAERGANHNPDVICSIPIEYNTANSNTINQVGEGLSYSFNVDASDLDDDVVYVDIKIDGIALTEQNVTMSKLDSNGLFKVNTQNSDREQLQVTIPANKLLVVGQDVTVVIKATDMKGAQSEIKTYKLRPIEVPKFNINAQLDIANLKKIDASGKLLDTVVSGTTVTVKPGDNVNVPYIITPQSLVYGKTNLECQFREAAVLIDNSIDTNLWSIFKAPLYNILVKLFGSTSTTTIRSNLIVFGDNEATSIYNGSDYAEITKSNLGSSILSQPLGRKNLNAALNQATTFLDSAGYPPESTSKNIIIFSRRNVTGYKELVNSNYNVITIQINDEGVAGEPPNALSYAHTALGGLYPDDYYKFIPSNNTDTDHTRAEEIMNSISGKIGRMKYQTYTLVNVEANFNLGSNINLVGNGLDLVENNTKNYKKVLPNIKYMAEENPDGTLNYIGHFTGSAQLDEYTLNFQITAAENALGLCEFSTPNVITYKYLEFGSVKSINIAETPKLQVENVPIKHGLYKGIVSGNPIIDETKRTFSKGAMVPFAGFAENVGNGNVIILTIASGANIIGDINVYEINSLGNVIKPPIGIMSGTGGSYTYTVSGLSTTRGKVLIMYNEKLPEAYGDYINTLNVQSVSKNAVETVNVEKPDLY